MQQVRERWMVHIRSNAVYCAGGGSHTQMYPDQRHRLYVGKKCLRSKPHHVLPANIAAISYSPTAWSYYRHDLANGMWQYLLRRFVNFYCHLLQKNSTVSIVLLGGLWLHQGCPTGGPQAASSPRPLPIRPATTVQKTLFTDLCFAVISIYCLQSVN